MVEVTEKLIRQKKTTDREVYQEIFDAILGFRLKPGTKLTEEDMSEIFGVGRTTIRRALVRLSHDHIVDIEPNKGAYVASPSVKKAREIFSARRLIEAAIVADVCKKASSEGFELLRKVVASEQDSVDEDRKGRGVRLSGDFHLMLAKVSGNSTLERIATTLVPQTSLIIVLYEKPGQPNCSHVEHFELIDVMQRGDVQAAIEMMNNHLDGIEAKLNLDEASSRMNLSDVFRKTEPSQ